MESIWKICLRHVFKPIVKTQALTWTDTLKFHLRNVSVHARNGNGKIEIVDDDTVITKIDNTWTWTLESDDGCK